MTKNLPWWIQLLPAGIREGLSGREGARRVVENVGWLMADRVFRLFLVFAVNVAVARYLGPDQFGLMSYVLAFVSLFAAFSNIGLDPILVREAVRHPTSQDQGIVFGTAVVLRVVAGFCGYLAVCALALLLHSADPWLLGLMALAATALLFQAFEVGDPWFQAKVASRYTVMARGLSVVLAAGIKLGFIAAGLSITYFIAAHAVEALLGSVLLFFAYRRKAGREHAWIFDRATARSLAREAAPLFFSALAVAAYMKLDVILLARLGSPQDVGYYSAAQRIVELWYFVPIAISLSVFPALVNSRLADPDLFFERLTLLYRFLIFTSVAFALLITVSAGWLISVLYGPSYQPAGDVLRVLAWASLATSLGVASSQFLLVEGLTRLALWRTLIGLSVSIAGILILAPRFQALGAAVATVVGYSVATFSIILFPGLQRHSRTMGGAFNPFPLWVAFFGKRH